jgi:hypothetical protein
LLLNKWISDISLSAKDTAFFKEPLSIEKKGEAVNLNPGIKIAAERQASATQLYFELSAYHSAEPAK